MRQIVAAHGCRRFYYEGSNCKALLYANLLLVLFLFLFSMKCAIPLAFLQSCKYNENHYHFFFQRDTGYPLPLVTPFSSGLLASQPRPRQASHIFIQKAARYSSFILFN
jgi:hypothetical protein